MQNAQKHTKKNLFLVATFFKKTLVIASDVSIIIVREAHKSPHKIQGCKSNGKGNTMENKNSLIDRINALEARMDVVNDKLDILTDEYERLENAIKAMDDVENILFGNMDNMSGWLEFRTTRDKLEDERWERSQTIHEYNMEYHNISMELNPLVDKLYTEEA